MNEKLLHFIWKYALFQTSHLKTTDGNELTIIQRGQHNTDAGPDFSNAKIQINDTIWAGNIELHVKESDWLKHEHQNNANFGNIILHVVYEKDSSEQLGNFPVLVLKDRIDHSLLQHYNQLMETRETIACSAFTKNISSIVLNNWLDRLVAERWEKKLKEWDSLLIKNNNDWRQLLYCRMAANFGIKVNEDVFLDLAMQTPLNVLAKHRNNLEHLEAILFGQAGLLPETSEDEYTTALKIHYAFFKQKYQLQAIDGNRWKFLRMRPASFPTIRIAQFAKLIFESDDLFSKIIHINNEKSLTTLLDIEVSEYWKSHYQFGVAAVTSDKKIGKSTIQNIIINTIAPIQFLYASHIGDKAGQAVAMDLLSTVSAENNHIIKEWKNVNIIPQNASQSQGLIHLYNHYCTYKRCLDCAIGNKILNTKKAAN